MSGFGTEHMERRDWLKICTLFGRGGAFGLVVLWSEGKEKISSGSGFIVTLMIQI